MLSAVFLHIVIPVIPVKHEEPFSTYSRSLTICNVPDSAIIILHRIPDMEGREHSPVSWLSTALRIEDSPIKNECRLILPYDRSLALLSVSVDIIKFRHCHFSSPTILATGSLHLK